MPEVIAYDVLRLFIGPASLTPRGIDRVDFALARGIFAEPTVPHIGILPTPMGTFALSARQVYRLLAYLDALWESGAPEGRPISDDPMLMHLVSALTGKKPFGLAADAMAASPPPLSMRQMTYRMLQMVVATGCVPRRLAAQTVPIGARYLNVGQLGLAMPGFFRWLDKRPDIVSAMMIHDAIPILHPDLVGAKAPDYHRQMIRTAAERADRLIFNSAYTRDSVGAVMRDLGYECPPALVRALPLPAAFEQVASSLPELAGIRYFVAISTIEPRKNYALLLRVWQRLLATVPLPPHLVIVGSPGREAESIMAPLRSDPELARYVHHVAGLSSRGLASLVLGATGVLCPSFVEGFGLSLLEASVMGVPAIASDIPAHREIACDKVILLPPDDHEGWARSITLLPDTTGRTRPTVAYAKTEAAYTSDILEFMAGGQGETTG